MKKKSKMSKSMNQSTELAYIESLEARVAELTKELDEYNERRCEAMECAEQRRLEIWRLNRIVHDMAVCLADNIKTCPGMTPAFWIEYFSTKTACDELYMEVECKQNDTD